MFAYSLSFSLSLLRLPLRLSRIIELTRGGNVYQAQNATMKPNHEKKKTRP